MVGRYIGNLFAKKVCEEPQKGRYKGRNLVILIVGEDGVGSELHGEISGTGSILGGDIKAKVLRYSRCSRRRPRLVGNSFQKKKLSGSPYILKSYGWYLRYLPFS